MIIAGSRLYGREGNTARLRFLGMVTSHQAAQANVARQVPVWLVPRQSHSLCNVGKGRRGYTEARTHEACWRLGKRATGGQQC